MIDFQQGPDDELLLRCECGSDHCLSFSRHEFRLGEEFYVSVIDAWRSPRGLWSRLKAAWTLFRRGEYSCSEIQLSKKNLADIAHWCDSYVPKTGGTR